MKKRKLISALALTLALLCGISIGATASNGIQKIQADLDSTISVKYNGETQTMLDANGSRIYPIAYNGTIYLPIRTAAGLAGLDANWDQTTRSVLLGKQPNGVDLIDTYSIFHTSKGDRECTAGQVQTADNKTAEISGVTQSHWISLMCAWGANVSASYNLQGKHETLTFSYYSDKDATLKVTGDDGMDLGEYSITGGAVAKTVTIPLFHTNELKFEAVPTTRTWLTVSIFDAYLDAE